MIVVFAFFHLPSSLSDVIFAFFSPPFFTFWCCLCFFSPPLFTFWCLLCIFPPLFFLFPPLSSTCSQQQNSTSRWPRGRSSRGRQVGWSYVTDGSRWADASSPTVVLTVPWPVVLDSWYMTSAPDGVVLSHVSLNGSQPHHPRRPRVFCADDYSLLAAIMETRGKILSLKALRLEVPTDRIIRHERPVWGHYPSGWFERLITLRAGLPLSLPFHAGLA